jgi:hypothetical protein
MARGFRPLYLASFIEVTKANSYTAKTNRHSSANSDRWIFAYRSLLLQFSWAQSKIFQVQKIPFGNVSQKLFASMKNVPFFSFFSLLVVTNVANVLCQIV